MSKTCRLQTDLEKARARNRGWKMSIPLQSYLFGRWQQGEGVETELTNPVTGELLATASARRLDLRSALDYARDLGRSALQELSYGQRAKLLAQIADVLTANKAHYEEIAIANSGNTLGDAAIDIERLGNPIVGAVDDETDLRLDRATAKDAHGARHISRNLGTLVADRGQKFGQGPFARRPVDDDAESAVPIVPQHQNHGVVEARVAHRRRCD